MYFDEINTEICIQEEESTASYTPSWLYDKLIASIILCF